MQRVVGVSGIKGAFTRDPQSGISDCPRSHYQWQESESAQFSD